MTFILGLRNSEALALFLYGCSPSGIQSNYWTLIFDGKLSLNHELNYKLIINSDI